MREFLASCRVHFFYAGVFSFFINILVLASPIYMLQVFDRVFSSRSSETLLMLTLVTCMALLTMMALEIVRSRLLLLAGIALDRRLGHKVLSGLLDDAARPGGSSYVHGLRDVGVLRGYLSGNGILALFDAPWMPVFMVVIFMFHPLLGAIALSGAVVLFGLAWLNEKITRGPQEELTARSRQAGRFIDAALRNAEVVRALGMGEAVTRRWSQFNEAVIESQAVSGVRASGMLAVTKFMRLLIQVLMLGVGAYLTIRQQVSSGAMIAGTVILAKALGPVENAISTWKGFIDARGAYGRLNALLRDMTAETDKLDLPAPAGRLTVERVVYALRRGEHPILKGVSLELAPGESLGIVGPSGAGKSTLARILAGVWKPASGVVRLDGADIAEWDRGRLAAYVGYLPQDVELFPGTVGENVARLSDGRDEQVVDAAQRALAHDMIVRLPDGYDTEIGDGGVLLSGGQRQRIGYARAIFGTPSLVILDEPNANLDGEGEEGLLRSMEALKRQGVTVVIISHKPSVLANVDKMLVLRDGVVESFGPRQEVMARLTGGRPTAMRNTGGINESASQVA